MKKRSQITMVHVSARMRESLRARLEEAARKNDVSLNTEMMRRLERSFEVDEANSLVTVMNAGIATIFEETAKRASDLANLPFEERVRVDTQALDALRVAATKLVQARGAPDPQQGPVVPGARRPSIKKETRHAR
jgi:hypothetical protein